MKGILFVFDVLPELLDQIPTDTPIDTIGGDGAYDTKQCHAAIAARDAQPSIPPREGAMPWPESTSGATWRNEAIDAIAQRSRREWKTSSGYHLRSLVETLMYRLKTLTGNCLWARKVGSQATEVAIRVGVLNRMRGRQSDAQDEERTSWIACASLPTDGAISSLLTPP
ncbi:IS5 family transposase (plasmid) [Cupriavidus oxalaticus]|uniref:IS5 family transposase n=1 Tax=Cupriavidus oxalaticus TaxID=96344 RepID=A0A4V1BZK6_9BURK|nr:IS5 family transposase [Cupriavidus oxalaticus]